MVLEDQVALVTGASRGLGLSIARALAGAGAKVACMARAAADLDAAVASLRAGGAEAMPASADVTDTAEVNRAVAAVLARWSRLDVLVLNAGAWRGAAIADTTDEQWNLLVGLNLTGAFRPLRAAIPAMRAAKRGTIVGICSIGGLVGAPNAAAYAASKWGLRGLLESAALELKDDGVRVSLVYPGDMNSAGRAISAGSSERLETLETADVASLVAFIAAVPLYVSVGNVTVWPIASAIVSR